MSQLGDTQKRMLKESIEYLKKCAKNRSIEEISIVTTLASDKEMMTHCWSGEENEGRCVIRIDFKTPQETLDESTLEDWSDNTVEDIKLTSDEQLTKAEKTIIIQQKIEKMKDTFSTGKGLFKGEDKIFKNIGEYLVSLKGNEEQVNRWVDQYLKDYTRWRLFDKRAIKAKDDHDERILKVKEELEKWGGFMGGDRENKS